MARESVWLDLGGFSRINGKSKNRVWGFERERPPSSAVLLLRPGRGMENCQASW